VSVKAISWAFDQALPHYSKFVLVALSNYANADGYSWPSQEHIAKLCGMSKRQVMRELKRLELSGYITKQRRYDPVTGHQMATMYHIDMARLSDRRSPSNRAGLSDRRSPSNRAGLSDGRSPSNRAGLSDSQACLGDSRSPPYVTPGHPSGYERKNTKEDTKERERASAREVGLDVTEKSRSKTRRKRAKQEDCQAVLPDWLSGEVWQKWITYCAEKKFSMTKTQQEVLIEELDSHRSNHDPIALLKAAMLSGWKTVYPKEKEKGKGNGNGNAKDGNRLSTVERTERDCAEWFRSRNGGYGELERDEFAAIEIDGQRIQ